MVTYLCHKAHVRTVIQSKFHPHKLLLQNFDIGLDLLNRAPAPLRVVGSEIQRDDAHAGVVVEQVDEKLAAGRGVRGREPDVLDERGQRGKVARGEERRGERDGELAEQRERREG